MVYSDAAGPDPWGNYGLGCIGSSQPTQELGAIGYLRGDSSFSAELAALVLAAYLATWMHAETVRFHSDALSAVTMLQGSLPVRPHHRERYIAFHQATQKGGYEWTLTHVPRHHNRTADRISRLALTERNPQVRVLQRGELHLPPTARKKGGITVPESVQFSGS